MDIGRAYAIIVVAFVGHDAYYGFDAFPRTGLHAVHIDGAYHRNPLKSL